MLLLSPRGDESKTDTVNCQRQDVTPGGVAPEHKPWAVGPRRLRNCSPSAGTVSCRSSMACPGQLFRGAGLKASPGQLPTQQPLQDG